MIKITTKLVVLHLLFSFAVVHGDINKKPLPPLNIITEGVYPMAFLDPEKNQITGFATQYLRDLLALTDIEYDVNIYPWTRTYRLALSEPNQLVISIARTPRREDKFIWFEPIMDLEFYLYGLADRKDELTDSAIDSKSSPIGVIRNDFNHEELQAEGYTNIIAGENAQALAYLLLRKRVDYIVTSDSALAYFDIGFQLTADQLYKAQSLEFMNFSIYYAFSKSTDPRIVKELTRASKELNARPDYVKPDLRKSLQ